MRQPSGAKAYDLADCLSNLRKSFTSRSKLIEQLYGLRVILDESERRPYLKLLAGVGVVRPALLEALLKARNAVEYQDARPPKLSRCLELVDAVWYFLRATDPLVTLVPSDMELAPPDEGSDKSIYRLNLTVRYKPKFEVTVSGWLPAAMVSETVIANYLCVSADRLERRSHSPSRIEQRQGFPDDVLISGKIVDMTVSQRRLVVSKALSNV